jgi:hypothetical protein
MNVVKWNNQVMSCNECALKLASQYSPGSTCNSQASKFRNACCNKNIKPTVYQKTQAAPKANPYAKGPNPSCPVCHYGVSPKKPNTVTAVLGMKGNPTCLELDQMGRAGQITTKMCAPLQDYMDQPCGCNSRWGVSSGATNKAPSNADTNNYNNVRPISVTGGYTKPTTTYRPPTNTNYNTKKPTTTYRPPTTTYQKPTTTTVTIGNVSTKKPPTTYRPSTTYRPPTATYNKPTTTYVRPGVNTIKLTIGGGGRRGLRSSAKNAKEETTFSSVGEEPTEENPFVIVQEVGEEPTEDIEMEHEEGTPLV